MWLSVGHGPHTSTVGKETCSGERDPFMDDEALNICVFMELGSGAPIFMEDESHLDREHRGGLAALTHSRGEIPPCL